MKIRFHSGTDVFIENDINLTVTVCSGFECLSINAQNYFDAEIVSGADKVTIQNGIDAEANIQFISGSTKMSYVALAEDKFENEHSCNNDWPEDEGDLPF